MDLPLSIVGKLRIHLFGLLLVAASQIYWGNPSALAVTPKSSEVKQLIDSALKELESQSDRRLGGKCLIGLAFVKAGNPSHPKVQEAVAACRQDMEQDERPDVYSNGIAIVFLCELNARNYLSEINHYLNLLLERQKPHGGWGYDNRATGDTSQTQYAALALWEANRNGFQFPGDVVARLLDWLLRTQDPDGGWAYQGTVGPGDRSAPQADPEKSVVMLAAGLSSVLICYDLLQGSGTTAEEPVVDESLPPALRAAGGAPPKARPPVIYDVDIGRFGPAIAAGNKWMDENFSIEIKKYNNYYLYALERFRSFQELYDGISPAGPSWYTLGFEYLKKSRSSEGIWYSNCGVGVDTAFTVLFLLRSTQKSIQASLGEGTLTGGRGLPADVANARLSRGQVIAQKARTEVADMLSLLDEDRGAALDNLARNPAAFDFGEVDEQSGRRLEQLARAPEPTMRLLAVRALGRSGNLDYVPTLVYALTDPDRRVALEARNGLRFTSRRFSGFGMPENYDEKQRYEAFDRWKRWYLAIRPDAVFEL